jgi:hypothetical protein
VADISRGVSAFFSHGQLSCFETLYLLGEQDNIVGNSRYAVHRHCHGNRVGSQRRIR